LFIVFGAVAQLGERLNGIQEADGSIPFSSTKHNKGLGVLKRLTPLSFCSPDWGIALFSEF
jgi:hypothetical protein